MQMTNKQDFQVDLRYYYKVAGLLFILTTPAPSVVAAAVVEAVVVPKTHKGKSMFHYMAEVAVAVLDMFLALAVLLEELIGVLVQVAELGLILDQDSMDQLLPVAQAEYIHIKEAAQVDLAVILDKQAKLAD
jgi:hypothetical protein